VSGPTSEIISLLYDRSSPVKIRKPRVRCQTACPRKDKRDFDLISDALPYGRLWYAESHAVSNAIGFATFYSRSHDAMIRVYDDAGKVIETHERLGVSTLGWNRGGLHCLLRKQV
jgi:hypothetical protein